MDLSRLFMPRVWQLQVMSQTLSQRQTKLDVLVRIWGSSADRANQAVFLATKVNIYDGRFGHLQTSLR